MRLRPALASVARMARRRSVELGRDAYLEAARILGSALGEAGFPKAKVTSAAEHEPSSREHQG